MSGSLYAEIQQAIYEGLGDAADILGTPFQVYRPAAASNPVTGAPLAVLNATFDVNGTFKSPREYAKATWRLYADATQTRVGDYLVEVSPTQTGQPARTFFVASQQPLLPPVAVLCPRTVSISRPTDNPVAGKQPGYMTTRKTAMTPLITGWPAGMLQGTKGEKSLTNLPGDTRSPWWAIFLPVLPAGITLLTDDVLVDDLGRSMILSSCELTELGWRLSAQEASL
jgi:hypothetical protein